MIFLGSRPAYPSKLKHILPAPGLLILKRKRKHITPKAEFDNSLQKRRIGTQFHDPAPEIIVKVTAIGSPEPTGKIPTEP